jgi:hypothetical protein
MQLGAYLAFNVGNSRCRGVDAGCQGVARGRLEPSRQPLVNIPSIKCFRVKKEQNFFQSALSNLFNALPLASVWRASRSFQAEQTTDNRVERLCASS